MTYTTKQPAESMTLDVRTAADDPTDWSDVQYIRDDLIKAVMPANWKDDPDWHPIAKALGVTE